MGWLWCLQSGELAFQDSRDGILKTQARCMVKVWGMDPRSPDAEVSSPDSDVRAGVRHSLRPDKNLCLLGLPNVWVASRGQGGFSCSGILCMSK